MRGTLAWVILSSALLGCSPSAPLVAAEEVHDSDSMPAPSSQAAEGSEQTPSTGGNITDIVELPYEGVSAHLEAIGSGYRLFYASTTAGGQVVSMCDANFSCENQAVLQRMSDLTVVETGSGERRGFWVEMNPESGMKELYTGAVSSGGIIISDRASLGFSGDISWGVPDAVTLPDGRVRVFWVEPGEGRASERIVSATSVGPAGREFEKDSGFRLEGGWVDFEVLSAEDGDWLAVMSTSPETLPETPQGIFLANSPDGLEWTAHDVSLTPLDKSYLDPTGVKNSDGSYTLIMSFAPNSLGTRDYRLASATLVVE